MAIRRSREEVEEALGIMAVADDGLTPIAPGKDVVESSRKLDAKWAGDSRRR